MQFHRRAVYTIAIHLPVQQTVNSAYKHTKSVFAGFHGWYFSDNTLLTTNSVVCRMTSAFRMNMLKPSSGLQHCLPDRRCKFFSPEDWGGSLFRKNMLRPSSELKELRTLMQTWTVNTDVHVPPKSWCPPKTYIVSKPRILSSWQAKCHQQHYVTETEVTHLYNRQDDIRWIFLTYWI
jgi:hypothetical protein